MCVHRLEDRVHDVLGSQLTAVVNNLFQTLSSELLAGRIQRVNDPVAHHDKNIARFCVYGHFVVGSVFKQTQGETGALDAFTVSSATDDWPWQAGVGYRDGSRLVIPYGVSKRHVLRFNFAFIQ